MYHIVLKFSIYLETPSPGKSFFWEQEKRATLTNSKKGEYAWTYCKDQRLHRNAIHIAGLLGPEVRTQKLPEI